MDIVLYNTLTGKKETFTPLQRGNVSIYQCGPTVYDYAHIGNLRAAITNDILRRVFEYAGYKVNQVMNITDIDDKTIGRSQKEGVPLGELTRIYEDFYFADLRSLNIKIPERLPHATAHIGGMIVAIEKLLREGYAYATTDGVYFNVSQSKNYGALAKLDLAAETQSRAGGEDKKNERDFALWKFWTPDDGLVAFDASFGRGRPGWHIECSVMAMSELGETLDIHTGGVDLIFPHHTNEIAQSEAITGKPFAHIWIHNEFVMIDGQKMSKSLGNHTTLKTVIEHRFTPRAFRYWVLGTHYRSQANFTWEGVEGAENTLRKLDNHINKEGGNINEVYRARFLKIITDDLDTPRALALAWEITKDATLSDAEKTATLLDFDRVFGLNLSIPAKELVPKNIQALIKTYEEARKNKNWGESDRLRGEIKVLGWEVADIVEGTKVTKIKV